MPKVSVIIPVYNTEKYVRQCIESVINQTFTDFEAILVDDGSPDRCGEIAEEYAEMDSRFIVVHQENQGLSGARNAGLKFAKGEYVGSVDPDDWILPEMYSTLVQRAADTKAEITCCAWYVANERGEILSTHEIDAASNIMNQTEFLVHMFDSPRTIGAYFWNKIIKTSWITVEFDKHFTLAEDRLFLFENSKGKDYTVSCVNDHLYVYRQRSNSLTHDNIKRQKMLVQVERLIMPLCIEMGKIVFDNWEKEYLDVSFRMQKSFHNNDCFDEEEYVSSFLKSYIRKNLKQICCNRKIFWKTRVMYLLWYMGFAK